MTSLESILTEENWRALIVFAGWGQLALVAVSPAIPIILRWNDDLKSLPALTRHVFWTYAAYVLASNLGFGLLSVFGSAALLRPGDPLAAAVCAFIALWWIARLGIQFFSFRTSENVPSGPVFRVAEVALVALFVCLATVYSGAAIMNLP